MRVVPVPLLLVATLCVAAHALYDACQPRPPLDRYATKSAYELVHSPDTEPVDQLQGCEAVNVWHMVRHGTRYMAQVAKIRDEVARLRDGLRKNAVAGRVGRECNPAVDRMLSWVLEPSPDQASLLTRQGELDMEGVGRRMRMRYRDLFERYAAQPGAFTFRSTGKQRTIASAEWYVRGLFPERPEGIDLADPTDDDPVMKFYAMCPAWKEAVDKNPSVHEEELLFRNGPVMRETLEKISHRLGFEDLLPYEDVRIMWEACRYEQAWNVSSEAPWCSAFDEEDLTAFEYMIDTKLYYSGGPGSQMDFKLGCYPIKDMFDKFSDFMVGNTSSRGTMYFTHSKALQLAMTAIGAGLQPDPLTADSFEQYRVHRGWRSTKLLPFASNLAFVLYQCPAKFKVRMYINEHPSPVMGCSDRDALCSWDEFQQHYESLIQDCSLDFCSRASSAAPAQDVTPDPLSWLEDADS